MFRQVFRFGVLVSAMLYFSPFLVGQDAVFSQFYMNPVALNPAFAGNTKAPRIALSYRNQWPGFSQAYVTYALSYDQFFTSINSGLGLQVMADDAGQGLYKTTKLAGVYSYNLRINSELSTKFGIEAGFSQSRFGWEKLVFTDQINPDGQVGGSEEPVPGQFHKNNLDVGIGMLLFSKKIYGGISLKHINRPDLTILPTTAGALQEGQPIRISVQVGGSFPVFAAQNSFYSTYLSPNLMIVKQGPFFQALAGTFIGVGNFDLGLWYRMTGRNPDAAIVSIGMQKGILRLGYSYDMTISALSLRSGGSHEVGVLINLDSLYPQESRYNDCFQIFR